MDRNITTEAKINYIYETLQKQERRYKWWMFFKWLFRILILIYIYIFIVYMLPGLIQNFATAITPKIPGITTETNLDTGSLLDQARQLLNR